MSNTLLSPLPSLCLSDDDIPPPTATLCRWHPQPRPRPPKDRKSTRLNSSHSQISYAVFCWNKINNSYPDHCFWFDRCPVPLLSVPSARMFLDRAFEKVPCILPH